MPAQNPAFPADEQQRAIDRPAVTASRSTTAINDVDAGDFRSLAKLVRGRARDLDGMGRYSAISPAK